MKDPHAAALGRKGGKAKTARKIAACRQNLEAARAKRWPKRRRLTSRNAS